MRTKFPNDKIKHQYFLNSMWVSIDEELPPHSPKFIIFWSKKLKRVFVCPAFVARSMLKKIKNGKESMEEIDKNIFLTMSPYHATHWMWAPGMKK